MTRVLLSTLILGLLVAAGCNKAEKKEAATTPPGLRAEQQEQRSAEDVAGTPEPGAPGVETEAEAEALSDTTASVREILTEVAHEYDLLFDSERDVLRGAGIRQEGIPLSVVLEKVQELQTTSADAAADLEQTVRTVLASLAKAGQAAAGAGASATETAASPVPQEESSSAELLHPLSVFGGWLSVREVHPRHTVEHSRDRYYEYVELHYEEGTAIWKVYRDGAQFSHVEYPSFQYDASTGALTLIGPGERPVETLTVWAKKRDHPTIVWLQPEHSAVRTEFEKIDRTGEPLSASETEDRESISSDTQTRE